MPVSSDSVQIAVIKESTYGVTPTTPAWQVLPITSEGVVAEVQTTKSALIGSGRESLDSILQSVTAAGDISTELTISPALEILIESAMLNDLVAIAPAVSGKPPMKETVISNIQHSFSFEKRFPDPKNPGSFLYQRATGCVVNTMNFSTSAGEAATMSFGIIGKLVTTDSAIVTGATYVDPPAPVVLRGPDTIKLDIGGSTMTTDCASEFGFSLNNNFRGIQCLGTLGNKMVVEGNADIELTATVMFSDNSFLDMLIGQNESAVDFEMGTGAAIDPGSYFASYFPRVKVTGNSVVAGGSGADVVNALSFMALKNTAGTKTILGKDDYDKTSMRVVVGEGALTP